jgi:drug/metabolite transporter (DMT)-like permease
METISSIKAALIFNLSPFLTVLFAYLLTGSKLNFRQSLGLIIGCIGVIPVLLTSTNLETTSSEWFVSWAELASIIATASISYSLVIMQKLIKTNGCPVPLANGISMLAGGGITLFMAFLIETPLIKSSPLEVALFALFQAVVINLCCANWRAHLLKKYSPTFMSFASLLVPISATCYGWLLFGETVSFNFIISFIIVVIGLGIYSTD